MRDRDKTGKPHPLFATVKGGRANQPPDPPRREPTSAEKFNRARAEARGRLAVDSLADEVERTKRPPIPPVDLSDKRPHARPHANSNTPRSKDRLSAEDMKLLGQHVLGLNPARPSGLPHDIVADVRRGFESATHPRTARTHHCRDCVYAKVGWWERLGYGYRYAICEFLAARYYVWSADTHYIVTGEAAPDDSRQDSCYNQRSEEGACGPNGRYFRPNKKHLRKLKKAKKITAKRLGE